MPAKPKKEGMPRRFPPTDFLCSSGNIKLRISRSGGAKNRIGVIVGTKFEKKSVPRNRIKRKIKEIIGKKAKSSSKKWNILAVVRGLENKAEKEKETKKNLNEALQKASIYFKEP
jgi:ribonuclease P protein component